MNLDLTTLSSWNDPKYIIKTYGDKIRVIILGERHGRSALIKKQLELISLVKPEFVLHEAATGWVYDPKVGKFQLQKNRFEEKGIGPPFTLGEFTTLASKLNFSLIGCDLTTLELEYAEKKLAKNQPERYMFSVAYEDESGIEHGDLRGLDKPSYRFTLTDRPIMQLRNQKMIEIIASYEKESSQPVLVIIGQWHSRDFHHDNLLQPLGFGFAIVNQCTGNHRRV